MGATADIDQLPRRPVYRSEYEALGRQGAFDDESVELLDGRIVYSAEEGPPHADVATRLSRLFIESIPADAGDVRIGNPIAISDLSEPEPELFVTTPRQSYRAAHPTTATLVIEVSQTSRRRDLGAKAALYASAEIPDYWVVDLTGDRFVVHRDPSGPRFASVTSVRDGILIPLHHPDVRVDVMALLR
jgi:Uma2 family endonuclease